MNLYATPDYLDVLAKAYFEGRPAQIEDVRIGEHVLRLLVVDGSHVVTTAEFLDYHEPLHETETRGPTREHRYSPRVVRHVIELSEWEPSRFPGLEPAPYVDWSGFPTFDDYWSRVTARHRGLLREYGRRRRRLVDCLGELEFSVDDRRADVLELARRWKGRQLVDTGARNYLAEPENLRYFKLLREHGLLTASTLRASGRLLSTWLGYIHEGVWSGWIFTYDPDPALRRYSLGHQLLGSMLEESHSRQHRQFDFSTGVEDYKMIYATHGRLIGDLGRPPAPRRLVTGAKRAARRALAWSPRTYRMARAVKRSLRRAITAQPAGEAGRSP